MNSTDPSGLCDDSGDGCSDGGDGGDGGGNGDGSGNGSSDGSSSAFDGSLGGAYSDPTTGAAYADVYAAYDSFMGASLSGTGGVWTSSQSFDDAVVSGLQFAVAIASNLPELGSVGNGINAAVSLARGNYKEAGLYSGAAVASAFGIPGAGAGVKAIEAVEAIGAAEEISQGTALIDEAAESTVVLRRSYIRRSVRQQVEEVAPRSADGRPIDPNTFQAIDGRPDFGHKAGSEFWREKQAAESEGLTQHEFNNRMNNPNKYQLENPSSNRSHRYEQPR